MPADDGILPVQRMHHLHMADGLRPALVRPGKLQHVTYPQQADVPHLAVPDGDVHRHQPRGLVDAGCVQDAETISSFLVCITDGAGAVAVIVPITVFPVAVVPQRLAVVVPSDELVILPGHGLSLFVCFHHLSSLS